MNKDTISPLRAGAARLRRGVLWAIFALVLMIPKVNRLRRQRRTWNLVRVLIAVMGAGILVLGVARGCAVPPLVVGALMLLCGLIVAPEHAEVSVDARARELGALIVVDGGRYMDPSGRTHRAKLFLAPDRLLVLNLALRILVEIPLSKIHMLTVEPASAAWSLRVQWAGTTANFVYEGTFGEHLAHVAEATLRGRLHRDLPVLG